MKPFQNAENSYSCDFLSSKHSTFFSEPTYAKPKSLFPLFVFVCFLDNPPFRPLQLEQFSEFYKHLFYKLKVNWAHTKKILIS